MKKETMTKKEWEKMHKVFINHLKHELKNEKYGVSEKGAIKNMLKSCEVSKDYPVLLDEIINN